jgi:hypothetical protein
MRTDGGYDVSLDMTQIIDPQKPELDCAGFLTRVIVGMVIVSLVFGSRRVI